jgi:hypothetical protein
MDPKTTPADSQSDSQTGKHGPNSGDCQMVPGAALSTRFESGGFAGRFRLCDASSKHPTSAEIRSGVDTASRRWLLPKQIRVDRATVNADSVSTINRSRLARLELHQSPDSLRPALQIGRGFLDRENGVVRRFGGSAIRCLHPEPRRWRLALGVWPRSSCSFTLTPGSPKHEPKYRGP